MDIFHSPYACETVRSIPGVALRVGRPALCGSVKMHLWFLHHSSPLLITEAISVVLLALSPGEEEGRYGVNFIPSDSVHTVSVYFCAKWPGSICRS